MSASSMEEQGKKTLEKVRKALGKKPKTAQEVATKAGIGRRQAAAHLKALVEGKLATEAKVGRSLKYALPESASGT